jgi:hypothetical protein
MAMAREAQTDHHPAPNAPAAAGPLSPAVLSIWNDIDEVIADEYEGWYQWDHLRDRVGVPGFRSCRRYVRVSGLGRQYFTFSDLDSMEVTRSPAYLERLRHVTDWTRRIMPHFRRLIRVPARVTVDRGDGTGGFAATALYSGLVDERRVARRDAIAAAIDRIMKDARVTRVRLFEVDRDSVGVANPEAALRPDLPATADIALVLEGSYEFAVWQQLSVVMALPELQSLTEAMPPSVYRLLFSSRS